jgi:hypothetical protein
MKNVRAVPGLLLAGLAALSPTLATAQTPEPDSAPATETRSTGLPGGVDWTFNFDATWGTFGFANSLFLNPREQVDENLSDQWFEGSVKPALSGQYRLANSSELYGKASAVGERTYGSVPELVGNDVSSFQVEDLAIGWRSGKTLESLADNAVDFTVGRAQYRLGHGFLLFDGAAEGGSRGAYWTNARKAFAFAAIGSFKPGRHKVDGFYLDKDDLPESDTGTRLWGANYEFSLDEHSTFGATYLKFFADPDVKPERDALNVFNVRAYTAPVPGVPDLAFELEYASERNGDLLRSHAWTLQGSYTMNDRVWTPAFTYRYAFFQGDDPETSPNEDFDPLLPGFYDYGTWWQGEIAGEYFLSNSNLKSHLIRVHVTPTDAVGGGMMLYNFSLDQPQSFGTPVTDKDLAFEIDAYLDWKVNDNVTLSVVGAYADPGKAVQQAIDRTKNFAYGMVFVAYSY